MAESAASVAHHGSPDVTRRDLLQLVTGATAAIGVGAAGWAFFDYMNPAQEVLALSAVEWAQAPRARAGGAPVLGQEKPIFVRHRTPAEIKSAEDVPMSQLIE